MRHVNIPVFIPHRGCPNDCVFCNQRTISGHSDYSPEAVRGEIEAALATIPENAEVQIAFFGGSFTGIDRDEMVYLLSVAKEFIDSGRVGSVRLSTRPDYIDDERLDILKAYGVKTIIFTDISKDGMLSGPNLEQLDAINKAVSCDITASGGIKDIGDIKALTEMGLYGAICGKSIYSGTLSLREAIEVANR